ncbi:hypothetical protein DIPPA_09021 [Diplonema papillatum]|nr:hypothetical protein DIPPA_09021 [Diplonema papillatum]
MRSILLIQLIKRLLKENEVLRYQRSLPAPTEGQTVYVDNLVNKWNLLEPVRMKNGITRGESYNMQQVAAFDEERDINHVFFPSEEYRRPQWNGRTGTQQVRKGTFIGTSHTAVSDVHLQLRSLYNYVLCAQGLNISGFMFPDSFKPCTDCPVEKVSEFVDTPVVLFCVDCEPQHQSNEFKLLCQGYHDEMQYGSKLFWEARSRLAFSTTLQDTAQNWLTSRGVSRDKLAAFRIPRSSRFRGKVCGENRSPTMCYTKLLQDKTRATSDNPTAHCYPPWDHIYGVLNSFAATHPDWKLFISTEVSASDWDALQANVRAPLLLHAGRTTVDSIVDTLICASAAHIVVNRFETKSTVIAEAFLLNNRLRKDAYQLIEVW